MSISATITVIIDGKPVILDLTEHAVVIRDEWHKLQKRTNLYALSRELLTGHAEVVSTVDRLIATTAG